MSSKSYYLLKVARIFLIVIKNMLIKLKICYLLKIVIQLNDTIILNMLKLDHSGFQVDRQFQHTKKKKKKKERAKLLPCTYEHEISSKRVRGKGGGRLTGELHAVFVLLCAMTPMANRTQLHNLNLSMDYIVKWRWGNILHNSKALD